MLQTVNDVWDWVQNNTPTKIDPGLERMKFVLAELGSPERRLKVIHIAGTNGKGSVATMMASVLQEAGYSVGLYISPPLHHWSERIQLNGEGIPESELVRWAERIRPIIEKMEEPPTRFEFWTLIAICYFAYEATPWFVILETGLGGRLDATNVVYPLVSIITEIARDHMEFLGESIPNIAHEKAGIIKSGVPVVVSAGNSEAVEVIRQRATELNSNFSLLGNDFHVNSLYQDDTGQTFQFENRLFTAKLRISLKGTYQLANAAAVIMAISILRQKYATIIDPIHLEMGLAKATWPGRMEEMGVHPTILLDGAHNASGIKVLVDTIQQQYTYDKLFFILATMREKEEEMIQPLLPLADHIVTTQVQNELRSRTAGDMKKLILKQNPQQSVEAIALPEEALGHILTLAGPRDMIVIAGSLYLLSQIRPLLLSKAERMG
jgi:dihydrofolate synthase / folylpolyglutamate synthase